MNSKIAHKKIFMLALLFSTAMGFTASTHAHAQTRTMNIAQIVPQSGPLANVGKDIYATSKATIDDFNSAQSKYKLVLTTYDDGNAADKSKELAQALTKATDALLSCFGTVGVWRSKKWQMSGKSR